MAVFSSSTIGELAGSVQSALSDWRSIVPLVAALLGLLGPFLVGWWKERKETAEKRARIQNTITLLRAQFGHIHRHSATNLKRLTEIFRAPGTGRAMVVALTKMSLNAEVIGNTSSSRSKRTPIKLARVEDIALFPEHLAKDVLRLEYTARNIEIDISDAIALFQAKPTIVFKPEEQSAELSRMNSLSATIQHCAVDAERLVAKLKSLEQKDFSPRWLNRLRKFTGRFFLRLWPWKEAIQPYRDDPINFADAMSHREVGDWVNWKDEQQLIPANEIAFFLRDALKKINPDTDAPVDVISQQMGRFNSISRCRLGTKEYSVRVRVNESNFRYEPGLVKEVFVAMALARGPANECDDMLAEIYKECLSDQPQSPMSFTIGPYIHYAAKLTEIAKLTGVKRYPYPCLVSDWVNTNLLSDSVDQAAAYQELAYAVNKLHQLRTKNYYRNFRELGDYRYARKFGDEVANEIKRHNDDWKILRQSELESLLPILAISLSENDQFCVCHNDLHPDNLFWNPSDAVPNKIVIIDWDNACISHPYLDFVKIKYWTKLSTEGRLTGDNALFEVFCRAYGEDANQVRQSLIFLALSLLWLMRVLAFERRSESEDKPIAPPFQPSKHYEKHIDECFRSLQDILKAKERFSKIKSLWRRRRSSLMPNAIN